jgi:leucyl/phenylalanyl-tRNA---protein transferase
MQGDFPPPPARSVPITSEPMDILWHYANAEMPFWINGNDGPVGWVRGTHRGVQRLDKIDFPKSQRRYIFSPKFEVRYNQSFEEVARECADLKREGKTFLTEELLRGYIALHKLGFAHSYEAWCDGKLAGGGFGLQLGSLLTIDSMFHRVSNASKAAYGQTLVRIRDRGFRLMDTNVVASHMVNYGEEWMRMWEYEAILRQALKESPSLTDERPYPGIPWQIRYRLPIARLLRKVSRRFRRAPMV